MADKAYIRKVEKAAIRYDRWILTLECGHSDRFDRYLLVYVDSQKLLDEAIAQENCLKTAEVTP
jgi:hypothetical protein